VNAAKSERPFFGRSTAAIAKAPRGSGFIGGGQVGDNRGLWRSRDSFRQWGKLQGAFLDEEKPMRSRIFFLALVSAALMEVTGPASAQSPYSYPWCSRQTAGKGDTTTCYFTSYAQCMTTISGIGGWCYQNPGYNGASRASAPRRRRY
jgi:hypothetical protein